MNISHLELAVAGILCMLAYGYAPRVSLPECIDGPGYVHLLEESTPVETGYVGHVYRIIGSSVKPTSSTRMFFDSNQIGETKRYPVAKCTAAMVVILAAIRVSGFEELTQDEDQFRCFSPYDSRLDIDTIIQSTLVNEKLVRVIMQPLDPQQSYACEHSPGYVHFLERRISQYGHTFNCVKVIGSSSVWPNLAALSTAFDLPYTEILVLSPIPPCQVMDCLTANEIINVLFGKFFEDAKFDLFGEMCYYINQYGESFLARQTFEAITHYFRVQPTVTESIGAMMEE